MRVRLPGLMIVCLVALGFVGVCLPAVGQEDLVGAVYAKGATWQDTVVDVRAKYQAWRQERHGGSNLSVSPWYATRFLKAANFAEEKFPERGVKLDAKAPDGSPMWVEHAEWVDGAVYDLPSDGSSGSTYLFRTITSPAAAKMAAGLGSDDGIEVWLNGEKILSNDVPRSAAPDQESLELALKEGENAVLIKIFNQTGGHGFYFSLSGDPVGSVWQRLAADFPVECAWVDGDAPNGAELALLTCDDLTLPVTWMATRAISACGEAAAALRAELDALSAGADAKRLDLYVKACKTREGVKNLGLVDLAAMKRAVEDLARTYPDEYTQGADYLRRIGAFEKKMPDLYTQMVKDPDAAAKIIDEMRAFQREALLSNPLLDIDRLLLVKRRENALGLPQNWQGNCAISTKGYDNEIAVMSSVREGGAMTTLYKPEGDAFVGDVDLNFDGDKMLFSMPGSHGRWQIWEMQADGTGLRQVTAGVEPDVDNYDACYLPDGRITYASTLCFQGIPCVGGGNTVANLCRMEADGSGIRQLCFDQDHNWCPTVLNNGRVMYTRWEYSDTPHYFSRLLFHMNPDGTNQAEYYGSNSFWPNSIFYARPLPGHPTAVVAIVSGHHGVARMGELVIFDPGRARFEADGVVQRIPGYGKVVEPVIMDQLVDAVWPKFLHPYPLSDKYFLVSCKPSEQAPWGIYLVDVFDNLLCLAEEPGVALLEPVPFRPTTRPPTVPDRIKPDLDEATVYLTDIYAGQGLKNVPRGTVKKLRIFEIYYTYPQMGGHVHIGVEGPWDVHRILGTVPVYEDGSAYFTIPSNIPVAVQPLDAEGRAVQIMRSWFVGMPGEVVSCVGCHERQNMTPQPMPTLAARQAPSAIEPWKGPARGFSFKRDVQPVLDKYCVGCHNGEPRDGAGSIPNFARQEKNGQGNFTPSYLALHPYVRRPGPESDYHVQKPTEFHVSTSELIQMLKKGHKGVELDEDAWDRLYTWIDLNVPDHGTWGEHQRIPGNFHARRLEMRTRYAGRPEDPEVIPPYDEKPAKFQKPKAVKTPEAVVPACEGWPFDAQAAAQRQASAGEPTKRTLDLGNGVTMELVLVPAGSFVMGRADGQGDERPATAVAIDQPFWMGTLEVTNAQYAQFDPEHDSGFIDQHNKDHTMPGYSVQDPAFPVIRISWDQASAFCAWLSEKTGELCVLPTEAQWEWACRAGSAEPFWYGGMDTDFGPCANLADVSIKRLAVAGINPQPIANPSPFEDFLPKDARFDDGERIETAAGKYQPSPWGLFDMHGNVAEWTSSEFRPYPYVATDGRENPDAAGRRVVRGGSWFDRPKRATASFRLAYERWQPVYNVGFRVVIPAAQTGKLAMR